MSNEEPLIPQRPRYEMFRSNIYSNTRLYSILDTKALSVKEQIIAENLELENAKLIIEALNYREGRILCSGTR